MAIEAALTEKEWADEKAVIMDEMTIRLEGVNRDEILIVGGEIGALEVVQLTSRSAPALIAIANAALPDDHPGKITRADVEALLESDRWVDDFSGEPQLARRLATLAAKLAALLPPSP